MKDRFGNEVGPSMLCPEYATSRCPLCNGCKKWDVGRHTCEKYPHGIPKDIRRNEYHECDGFVLDEASPNAPEVKRNIERLK